MRSGIVVAVEIDVAIFRMEAVAAFRQQDTVGKTGMPVITIPIADATAFHNVEPTRVFPQELFPHGVWNAGEVVGDDFRNLNDIFFGKFDYIGKRSVLNIPAPQKSHKAFFPDKTVMVSSACA